MEKDSQLRMMGVTIEEMRIGFERVLSEALRGMRNRLVRELPGILEKSRTVKYKKEVFTYPAEVEQTKT